MSLVIIRNGSLTLSSIPESFTSSILSQDVVNNILKKWREKPMLIPRIAKVTINISVGGASERLEKAARLLEQLTGQKPSIRKAKKTIREFGISRRQPIAAVVTLRGQRALEFLRKALYAVNNTLKLSSFDKYGNVSFGIKEHLLLPGVRYDPDIGIFGMDVALTLERPGFRIMKRRRRKVLSIPNRHRVSREESILLLEILFGTKVSG
ncbi:50S ribosomal protein L5 [Ignisphaera sp. 4213-co]|uniref:Large ribosomal subunit protein uL5 n=1 Tax=Ignisphaera cupida TaxID=3050454 RepID=A0ABD4Z3Q6_9CREN|nr:50S ribosomal protein L5 [Ignisphaera sp. 4213-co]MDK6027946.1 50S ribosomal protein L5 [Ignisphaera sp. 4213-co]